MPQQTTSPTLAEAVQAAIDWLNKFGEDAPFVFGGEAELSDTLQAAFAAHEAALNQKEQMVKPAEANLMDLSPDTVQLAHQYMTLVEDMERGHYDRGYTPEETDRQRVKLHNKFLSALRRDHVDCSVRTDTTVLARRIVEWIPE